MLFALALYASTAHAGIPAYSVERPAPSTRTRRNTHSRCWGVKARMARGENLPSTRPSSSPPRRGTGHRRGRGTCRSNTGTVPGRLRSGGLDFDRPRRRGLRRGDPHLEHAVRVLRLHVGGVDALRKGEIPLERAVRDFADKIVLARGVVIGF